jgi:hypothetical protein
MKLRSRYNDVTANSTITFKTPGAFAIWIAELTGQMSDGMWENTTPYGHWRFWSDCEVQLGDENKVETDMPWAIKKAGYNFGALIPYVGDRMIAYGRMAQVTLDSKAIHAAEYMPETFEEWCQRKEANNWKYSLVERYMESVSVDMALRFYRTTYTIRNLKNDIKHVKAAMKNKSSVRKTQPAYRIEPVAAPVEVKPVASYMGYIIR